MHISLYKLGKEKREGGQLRVLYWSGIVSCINERAVNPIL
jgi:hypothetical protein